VTGLEETVSSEDKGKTELCPDVLGVAALSGTIEDPVAPPPPPVLQAIGWEIVFTPSQR
jgi:hypothetical protein